MNRVNIETAGPVMENLCRVEVSDDYDSETIHLDNADVEAAVEEGTFLEYLSTHLGNGATILRDAATNGSPVYLNDEIVDQASLDAAFGRKVEPQASAGP